VNTLFAHIPTPPSTRIDWLALRNLLPVLESLHGCPQDAIHHAEGDVATHTGMVCDALVNIPAWQKCTERDRFVVFAAALLHDVGKPSRTRMVQGRLTSRGHSHKGEIMARVALWELDVPLFDREQIASLIRYHQVPFFLLDRPDSERVLFRVSQSARCDLLAMLAEADALGRVCSDRQKLLDNIALFVEYARERDCLYGPRLFASDHSRFQYFRSEARSPDYDAYDDTRLEAVLMSGLPASGKDTWTSQNLPAWPVVCLDDVRRQMKIDPAQTQGRVVSRAREMAREYLRKAESFVWNATNISRQVREACIALFADYDARIRVVHVELPPDKLYERNRARPSPVPDVVLRRLIDRWEVPDLTEAHHVDYIVTE